MSTSYMSVLPELERQRDCIVRALEALRPLVTAPVVSQDPVAKRERVSTARKKLGRSESMRRRWAAKKAGRGDLAF